MCFLKSWSVFYWWSLCWPWYDLLLLTRCWMSSTYRSISFFSGIELMANKLHVIVQTMKKKKYDVLDARKDFFDNDFEEFKRSIDELHVSGFYIFPWDLLLVNSLRERRSGFCWLMQRQHLELCCKKSSENVHFNLQKSQTYHTGSSF